jgi:hypothetical protein
MMGIVKENGIPYPLAKGKTETYLSFSFFYGAPSMGAS